jgi:hypothetical protein
MTASLHASTAEGCVQNGLEPEDPAPSNFGGEVEAEKFEKPLLLIDNCNPDQTVARLRDILANSDLLYDRGVPVWLDFDQMQGCAVARIMTPDRLVLMAHEKSRPYAMKSGTDGSRQEVHVPLPPKIATMYLGLGGKCQLRPLNGIVTTPILREDGSIISTEGYDAVSGLWCEKVPDIGGLVSEKPTKAEAQAALKRIREVFKTFPFADADLSRDRTTGELVVEQSKPIGQDESSFLNVLMTAVCRASLYLAPGVLVWAPPLSGAGAGKGLLGRCICIIAYGCDPHAVTAGANPEELEKRISAELMQAGSVVFLDNMNGRKLKSEVLASILTERPSRTRVLGKSEMVVLNSSALVILTGNGLELSEDLARRFIVVELDARTEHPEARKFSGDIRREVTEQRTSILADLLTIWRWGRMTRDLPCGQALGNYAEWCLWVRDPLLALGCQDPVQRVIETKEHDSEREWISELFHTWDEKHGEEAITADKLHPEVKKLIDPNKLSRQNIASMLKGVQGTRLAGFVLISHRPSGKWSPTTYVLKRTGESNYDPYGHAFGAKRTEDNLGEVALELANSMTPMTPIRPSPALTPGVK